jgi:DNA-binding transcriptional MerR regulator
MVLGVIVGAQRTGFSLDEIRQVLPADLGKWRHGELLDALRRKVADIEQMQQRLGQSKRQLYALIRKIECKPDAMGCTDNTKRLLKEFVPNGSPPRRPNRSLSLSARSKG